MIDPYDWLNIPPEERPPTLYQLLAPDERDAAALEKAAAQQMEQARKYQLQYVTEATELLNALAQALKQAPRRKRSSKSFQQDQDKGFSIPSANFGDFFRNPFDSARTKR